MGSVAHVTTGVRGWLAPGRVSAAHVANPAERRLIVTELFVVFSVTLGLSAVRSLLSLLDALVRPGPLKDQQVALNAPQAQADLIDLALQLTRVLQLVAWGALAAYLLLRAGVRLRQIGLDRSQPGRDAAGAAGLALLVGVPGLALYVISYAAGLSLAVLPSTLGDTWWRTPVLVLSAIGNAWAEEVIVVGYLLTRLRQLGWMENRALLVSALLRGAYHLYQGFGGFLGNFVMGLLFGRVWQRTGRLWMLVGAHSLLDIVAFVGYALLRGHVGWLP
jgi:membrane protease YdiL (CAAX protease family)